MVAPWGSERAMASTKGCGRRLLLQRAASALYHRLKLVFVIMSQASGSGAAASPQLPGLQLCDISHLILDSATEPKEGGFGNTS